MRLQHREIPVAHPCQVIRFIPPAEFKREAYDLMNTMTTHLLTLEKLGKDPELTVQLSRTMNEFHHRASVRGLKEIAELALQVAKALEKTEPGPHDTTKRVVALSLAAVSQIQWLLNPSVEGAGNNARTIIFKLLQQW